MVQKLKKNKKNKRFIEIYGFHAVQAALKNKHRKHKKLIISQKIYHQLSNNLKQKVSNILVLPNKNFSKIYGNEDTHQNIILETSELSQLSLDDILKKTKEKKTDVVIMLDHVTDTNNIGSIMRSCALFNCNSVIVAKDNSPDITSSMVKAASGAIEAVNYLKVTNLSQTIIKFKQNSFLVLGFDSNVDNIKDNFQFPKKCLLVFGAEGRGLRELTKKQCDQILKIPMNYNFEFGIESLNISNACTIALYEHFKIHK